MTNSTLTSWKEIAAYLGKGVRTVQRWERQFGLPVRRPNAKSHIIFALPQELDAWIGHHETAQRLGSGLAAGIATTDTLRTEQHALLTGIRRAYARLEAIEQELGKNRNRLMGGLEGPRASNSSRSAKRQAGKSQAKRSAAA